MVHLKCAFFQGFKVSFLPTLPMYVKITHVCQKFGFKTVKKITNLSEPSLGRKLGLRETWYRGSDTSGKPRVKRKAGRPEAERGVM